MNSYKPIMEEALEEIRRSGRLDIQERVFGKGLNTEIDSVLKLAAEKALNYIENTESELGIKLSCGDALRVALTSKGGAGKNG